MSEKDVFEGAKVAYIAYFSYVKVLMDKYGTEEALKLMTKSDTIRGISAGADIKAEAGGRDFTVKETMDTIVEMAKGIGGIDTVLEVSEDRARTVTELGKCPVYEAGRAVGMEDELIEKLCRASSLAFLNSVVQQLNPELGYYVTEFRSETYQGCVEEIRRNN